MLLYHFVSAEHGLLDIRNRHLKIATFDNLNDPFELHGFAITKAAERRGYEAWVRHMSQTYGLLCFSESWTNPVQWSHYADRHHGLCLGFVVSDKFAQQVRYVTERPRIALLKERKAGTLNETFMTKVLCTKYIHWQYEQEWRLFLPIDSREKVNGLFFEGFGSDIELAKVFIGPLSTTTSAEITEALGDLAKRVQINTTRLGFQTYEVRLQKSFRLQK